MINPHTALNDLDDLQIGDLIFVSSKRGIGAYITKFWQTKKVLTNLRKNFLPTHVAIATGEGNQIFHSTSTGVHFSSLVSYINNRNYSNKIVIIRNKRLEKLLSANPSRAIQLKQTFDSVWGQKYNLAGAILRKPQRNRKFCSELAVDFLKQAGFMDAAVNAHDVYPKDLLQTCRNPDEWRVLSPSYPLTMDKDQIEILFKNFLGQTNDASEQSRLTAEMQRALQLADTFRKSEETLARYANRTLEWSRDAKAMTNELREITKNLRK